MSVKFTICSVVSKYPGIDGTAGVYISMEKGMIVFAKMMNTMRPNWPSLRWGLLSQLARAFAVLFSVMDWYGIKGRFPAASVS